MKILNFGSLNIDHVYTVPHFLRPGETMAATSMGTFLGGKGLNQSVALARAGGQVFHAGCVGAADGAALIEALEHSGADTTLIRRLEEPSGHAIIQVDPQGHNCILLFGGANQQVTPEQIDETLRHFGPGDILVLQNEISGMAYLLRAAAEKGMTVALNPSPMSPELLKYPLEAVGYFLLNEVEARDLCGEDGDPETYPEKLLARWPNSRIVLTLGEQGCIYQDATQRLQVPARRVQAVDTTAAGDTFSGFFLAAMAAGRSVQTALETATAAAAIAVSRPGASPSIPTAEEVETFLRVGALV